eukprot:Tbor_TRINITY_DN10062_c0_g1::TRINITY_DN10062_c0_g1_i1::g.12289::m.12289
MGYCTTTLNVPHINLICGLKTTIPSSIRALTHQQTRSIIQSYSRPKDVISHAERKLKGMELKARSSGQHYAKQQRMWASTEGIERALTSARFELIQRTPLNLLPRPVVPRSDENGRNVGSFTNNWSDECVEGNGAYKLLSMMEKIEDKSKSNRAIRFMEAADIDCGRNEDIHNDFETSQESGISGYKILENKIMPSTIDDEVYNNTTLKSLVPTKKVLIDELLHSHSQKQSERQQGVLSWNAIPNLDPFIATCCREKIGPFATSVQSRLVSALLHEDHNDVLFNAPMGAGRTWAQVIAALNGVRTETSGINILVAPNKNGVSRMHDMVATLVGTYGGTVAERDVCDMESWIFTGRYVENCKRYWDDILKSAYDPRGGKRLLILTSEVLTELFFQHKLQFKSLGYLRRCYFDDVGQSLQLPNPDVCDRLEWKRHVESPRPIELALMTLHQMPGPHIRSLFQLGLVGNDIDTRTKDYLIKLCIKPDAKTIILAPMRFPSSLHCTFSFYNTYQRKAADSDPTTAPILVTKGSGLQQISALTTLDFVKDYIYNARSTIPGRGIIFIEPSIPLSTARSHLRKLGMDVKVLSEVMYVCDSSNRQEWRQGWKFLVMHEADAVGLELPLVSHVFITFCPSDRRRYNFMGSVASRVGSTGWVTMLCPQVHAPQARNLVEELDINFVDSVTDINLNKLPRGTVDSFSRALRPTAMESPQLVVKAHYEYLTEHSSAVTNNQFEREFFAPFSRSRSDRDGYRSITDHTADFHMIDYEPRGRKQTRFNNASLLANDIQRNPSVVIDLQRKGLLSQTNRPTKEFYDYLSIPKTRNSTT